MSIGKVVKCDKTNCKSYNCEINVANLAWCDCQCRKRNMGLQLNKGSYSACVYSEPYDIVKGKVGAGKHKGHYGNTKAEGNHAFKESMKAYAKGMKAARVGNKSEMELFWEDR